jgi:probable F420-dependent oxidoreductase
MDLGISLPTYGPEVPPETIALVAVEAERMGYAAVWTYERLLRPVGDVEQPGGRGPIPTPYAVAYDPLATLSYVAAKTSRVKLGTSVLDVPFHVPVMLAKRLATLDRFSGGRVIAGLGQGWMPQEFATANVSYKLRGKGFEEFVAAMRAAWGPDPVSFDGQFYSIAPSQINPKPAQPGGIPILMGVFAPVAIARAARIADGLNPIAVSWEVLEGAVTHFRDAARSAGRDPETLTIMVRANVPVTATPIARNRPFLGGSPDQIAADLERLRALRVDHVFFSPPHSDTSSVDELLGLFERLIQVAG